VVKTSCCHMLFARQEESCKEESDTDFDCIFR
jgi:hypothetical protein